MGENMTMSGSIRVRTAGMAVRAANKGRARFLLIKAREDNKGNCYLGGCDVSAVDEMSFVSGEIIQIKLKDEIPTSQFWTDVAHNGDQIYFSGNE